MPDDLTCQGRAAVKEMFNWVYLHIFLPLIPFKYLQQVIMHQFLQWLEKPTTLINYVVQFQHRAGLELDLFLSDEGPMLETLDHTIRIGSTPTFLYFNLYLHSAYAAHYVYSNLCCWFLKSYANLKFKMMIILILVTSSSIQ